MPTSMHKEQLILPINTPSQINTTVDSICRPLNDRNSLVVGAQREPRVTVPLNT